ncbi:hypothetical protein Syun_021268 [Stephania yunnanensis]|uniref:Pentatricopeptide repeat-containing protein n=1 Tax=Stephania yunnanensis TaxID=152371 RepID=A0AAP0IFD5_9MAGN
MPQDVCGATEGFTIYCPRLFVEFATEGFTCLIGFVRDPEFTLVGAFDACTTLDWFKFGKVIHDSLIRRGMELNAFVGSSIVGMYSKSGVLSNAKCTFEDINPKGLIAWNSMITAFVQNKHSNEVLKLLCQIMLEKLMLNNFTFAGILSGFVNAMALQLGRQVHGLIIESRLTADIAVANALITIYANFACAREAEQETLLSACRSCGDFHRLERSVERIMALEPNDLAAYLLLSNTYVTHGQWKDVLKVRKLMKQNGLKKEIGKSWIEVHNVIHEFGANDRLHTQADGMYEILHELFIQIKETGYEADPNSILIYEMEYYMKC